MWFGRKICLFLLRMTTLWQPLLCVILLTRRSYIDTKNYQLLIFGSPVRIESITSTNLNKWLFLTVFFLERLAQNTKVFQQWLDQTANDWENVLFIALAKGFGLSVNGLGFAVIAQSIPFSVIRKTQDHEELEALLFGQADMLKSKMDDAYLEKLQNKYRYAKHKLQLKGVNEKVKFFRMRSNGFPTIRLSQLAQLYALHSQLLNKIIEGEPQKNVEQLFHVSASNYWSTHHVFGKEHTKRNKALSKSFLDYQHLDSIFVLLLQSAWDQQNR